MVEGPGRRERKKQLTRQALVDAAVRLFTERGYERTTVADIAEAADVSTRTFFLHFPTKEDVLLADADGRVDSGVAAVAGAASPAAALAAAAEAMISDAWRGDLRAGPAGLRARLVVDNPAVQARLLQVGFAAQTRLADALREAHPDLVDDVDAAALVGALLGAVATTAVAALRRGDPPDAVRDAMRRAAELALRAAG
ncbi:TetR/AcrR family transcriptional regulator [Pseudonocardia humida]|uniref:TetR/AcrR family transcriptional regulator n=1 Tax=Pseudonocardia humida TaxID=2800819 RepID=A0ABT0ZVA9_9PSEU|nr:TetR/AcrR family transcriptional regulator [Pseudonocardia humida]MCO1654675.1 TetR/AcrR family transcriptional regulator [Pseudonocardia humida]